MKIKHPKLDLTREVKNADLWLAAGWLLAESAPEPEPIEPEVEAEAEPVEVAPKPSRRRKAS